MNKLENIPKKNIYQVPDDYFERLPQIVQKRVSESSHRKVFVLEWRMLRYAAPLLTLALVGLLWWQSNRTIEEQLGQIEVDQLAYFLDDADFTTEELAETVIWSKEDLDELEQNVYSTLQTSGSEWQEMVDELDLDIENF